MVCGYKLRQSLLTLIAVALSFAQSSVAAPQKQVPVATAAPTRASTAASTSPTTKPSPTATPRAVKTIPISGEVCDAFSDASFLSGEINECLQSNYDLLSEIGKNGAIHSRQYFVSAMADEDDSAKPKRTARPPKNPQELVDIVNSSCRVPGEAAGTVPNRLKGYAPYYNLRTWCCQHSAYLTVVAADKNDIRSQIIRVWHGGWHIVSAHECFVGDKVRVVVMDYGKAVGYLDKCPNFPGRLCLYTFDGTQRGDYSGFERWVQPGCKQNDIGTFLPTTPGDAPRPPAPACPNGDPYWCQTVER